MNAIVVVDQNWAIGKDGGLLFSLPSDMKRFRALTMGGTVLMGRKTLESFPGGKPLPGRRNIMLTSGGASVPGVETVHCLPQLREVVSDVPDDRVFVIGGGSVYRLLLPCCKRVYLTRVFAAAMEPDTFFPNLEKVPGWEVETAGEPFEENGVRLQFVDYVNRGV